MRSALAFVVVAMLSACASHPPPAHFPAVGPLSDGEVIALVTSRASAAKSLYAVVTISYDGPDMSGTFDAACHFLAPGRLRMTAWKDLVLASEDVFDIIIKEDAYSIDLASYRGSPAVHDRGPAADFPKKHSAFAGFFWAGEALFRPGVLRGPATVSRSGAVSISGTLPTGATVTWTLEPRTLAPVSGLIAARDGREVRIAYDDWRLERGVYVPGSVVFTDSVARATVTTRVKELEVDPALDASIFEIGR